MSHHPTIGERIRYRAKAILAAAGILATSAVTYLVTDPGTATAIEHVVPAGLVPFVPLVLGVIATAVVHEVPNGPKPTSGGYQ